MTKDQDTEIPDDQYFADLIEALGIVEALRIGAEEFHQAVRWMRAERDPLVERHLGKWAARSKDQLPS